MIKTWLKLRNLNELKRFNIRVTLHSQNVSSHSLFVGILAHSLCEEIKNKFNYKLNPYYTLLAALSHDFEESELGDILIPSKNHISNVYEGLSREIKENLFRNLNIKFLLTPLEEIIIKFSDKLEGYVYCLEEVSLGNNSFRDIAESYRESLSEIINSLREEELREYFRGKVEEVLNEFKIEK